MKMIYISKKKYALCKAYKYPTNNITDTYI